MCNDCIASQLAAGPRTERRKIWEIEGFYHCTILGTCLTIRELERIAARAGIELKADATEYAIHVTFVNFVTERREVAKLIHKALDKKYKSAIERTRRFESVDELMAYWRDNVKSGRIPGAFWATMSHRLIDELSSQLVFGDVHMLSHMVGAANRADLKRLDELERARQSLGVELEETKIRHRQAMDQRNAIIADQQKRLAGQEKLHGRLVALEAQLAQYEKTSAVQELTERSERLEDERCRLEAALERAEERASRHEARCRQLSEENGKLAGLLQDTIGEADHLEQLLESGLANAATPCDRRDDAAFVDLDGATVLYVGGRTSQMSYFRTLVERANGSFIHHDGGLEDGEGRLQQVLSRGDIVMCPVDCVSHGACWRAKTYCKRAGKCFVPLRSSGLSSFVTGLQDAAAADG